MNDYTCFLTIGDFTTLKTLEEQWSWRGHALAPLLRAKLEAATVVFPDDLPRDVASLGSQIAYAIGEERYETVLTSAAVPERGWLPITTPIGLALLGQREGWAKSFEVDPGRSRLVTLGRVVQQPEAAWPGRFSPHKTPAEPPPLRLVRNSTESRRQPAEWGSPEDDDPGPAAA